MEQYKDLVASIRNEFNNGNGRKAMLQVKINKGKLDGMVNGISGKIADIYYGVDDDHEAYELIDSILADVHQVATWMDFIAKDRDSISKKLAEAGFGEDPYL